MNYKYIFGPVPSRRLGISLGIELVPQKVCNLNCVYCECGKTTLHTNVRKEYNPIDLIIPELKDFLEKKPELDYLTLTGCGEPTLNSRIGDIVSFIKKDFPEYKISVLTNGTLLYLDEVINSIKEVDLVKISLDAVSEKIFKKVNNLKGLANNQSIIDGIVKFRKIYKGQIWLEIFIVPDVNDNDSELALFKEAIFRINPDKVQLNSLDRPSAFSWVEHASKEKMEKIQQFLKPIDSEIVSKFYNKKFESQSVSDKEDLILNMLTRRPCTIEDIKNSTGLENNVIEEVIKKLSLKYTVITSEQKRGIFFSIK
jgi:wyosine [tRNA(Phe)-imidazoG37] synthetase (radical SAM superfamily)